MTAPASGVRRTTLPSGLRIVTEQVPGVRSAAVGVWVNVGSRHETPSLHGGSHGPPLRDLRGFRVGGRLRGRILTLFTELLAQLVVGSQGLVQVRLDRRHVRRAGVSGLRLLGIRAASGDAE